MWPVSSENCKGEYTHEISFIINAGRKRPVLALTAGSLPAAEQTEDFDSVPVKGMVTMIDLGAHSCIPCKMMAPIMEKMDKLYEGKAAIVFIDVWKSREQAGGSASGLSPHRSSLIRRGTRSTATSDSWRKRISSHSCRRWAYRDKNPRD